MGLLADYMPNWLPNDPNQNAAARQGLLQFGAALLGGRGNFGSILGQGLQAGAGGYNSAMSALQQKALMDAQTQHLGLINQEAQAQLDAPGKIASILNDGSMPAPAPSPAASLVTGTPPAPLSNLPQMTPAPDAKPLSALPQMSTPSTPSVAAPSAPAQPAAQPVVPPAQADLFTQYMGMGDKLTRAGYPAQAKPYYDLAQKLKPEVQEVKTAIDPTSGQPVQVITFKDGSQKTSSYGALPDNQVVDLGGQQVLVDKNTGKQGAAFTKSQTPDSIASNATTRRGQDLTHSDNTAGDQAPITDAAIVNAAARYNLDGTLPPMGMGKNAAAGRSAILNKAAELAAGIDPTEQRAMQLAYKGDVKAKTAAIQAFTSGKLGNTVRSFNVLQSHLDTFGKMADALDNGNVQMVNKFGNMIAAQTGQAAPTNFEAIKHIVGDEIVKAVTGSAGALGDREAAAKTIASINSPAQLKGVIDSYRELAQGQLQGLRQQYQTSTGRNDFDKFLSPNAKASVAPVAALPQKAGPPPDISNLLTKYGKR